MAYMMDRERVEWNRSGQVKAGKTPRNPTREEWRLPP
jgi:hypothetical protein